MNYAYIIALIVYLAAILIGRIMAEHAIKSLPTEFKAGLIDDLRPARIYSIAIVVLLLLLFFLAIEIYPGQYISTLILFFFSAVIISAAFLFITLRTFRRKQYPTLFIRRYLFARSVVYSGMAIMLFVILHTLLSE